MYVHAHMCIQYHLRICTAMDTHEAPTHNQNEKKFSHGQWRELEILLTSIDILYTVQISKKKNAQPHWAEGVGRAPPGGVWVGVCFRSRLYYPFGKGPGQHIIRCLKNKKCENERTNNEEERRDGRVHVKGI